MLLLSMKDAPNPRQLVLAPIDLRCSQFFATIIVESHKGLRGGLDVNSWTVMNLHVVWMFVAVGLKVEIFVPMKHFDMPYCYHTNLH